MDIVDLYLSECHAISIFLFSFTPMRLRLTSLLLNDEQYMGISIYFSKHIVWTFSIGIVNAHKSRFLGKILCIRLKNCSYFSWEDACLFSLFLFTMQVFFSLFFSVLSSQPQSGKKNVIVVVVSLTFLTILHAKMLYRDIMIPMLTMEENMQI